MRTLNEVRGGCRHIVSQVVKAELIVRTEGDVRIVSLAAPLAVGLVLVDTVDTQPVKHIERSHPLGVTLSQIVIDRDHMDTIAW